MAQVTMSGIEFKDLMRKEDQLNELVNYLMAQRKFSCPEGSVNTYSCGQWKNEAVMPLWLKDMYVTALLSQLIMKSPEELSRIVKADCHYYAIESCSLYSNQWDDSVDLLEYSPQFKEIWENTKKALEAEEEDEEDA